MSSDVYSEEAFNIIHELDKTPISGGPFRDESNGEFFGWA